MKQSDLDEVLRKHGLWVNDADGGEIANLRSANLRSANLSYSIGNSANLKSIQSGTYEIIYSDKVMAIGCEQHDIKDWWKFDDEKIDEMDGGASLKWWKAWKPILKKIIKVSPAEPNGYEESK